jgi:hypothetical protein
MMCIEKSIARFRSFYNQCMPTLKIRITPSPKLRSAPKAVRERFVQQWLNFAALSAPEFIMRQINEHPTFQNRTGWAATKWKGEVVDGNKLRVSSLVAYTFWLNYGVRPHQMTYLLGKTIPINGSFRKVTVNGLMKGGWRHPGRAGGHFFEQGIASLMKFMQQKFVDLKIENQGVI